MDRAVAIATLRSLLPDLQRAGVSRLDLIGSVARGEARPGSDVDVLVEWSTPPSFRAHLQLVDLLQERLGCQVDVVPRSTLKSRAWRQIEQEAIRVA